VSRPTTAVLFPGQGSQTDDMREHVERLRPDLLELAEAELGADPFARVAEGTHFAQPAIYCASLAGWARVAEDLEPDYAAGHSLGEVAALVAAEALDAADGLRLVIVRGRLMQEAGERTAGGGMLAILSGAQAAAGPLAERHGLVVANDNAPEQVVLSGDVAAIDGALAEAKGQRLRATKLPVTGAFHSPAMAYARPELEAALACVEWSAPRFPVLSGVTAAPFDDPAARLLDALTSPVRWREVLLALAERGVTRTVETGPGKVLTGLVRRTLADVEAVGVDSLEAARA
jgi:malonyl CoA-acyl carrier protein transacylase